MATCIQRSLLRCVHQPSNESIRRLAARSARLCFCLPLHPAILQSRRLALPAAWVQLHLVRQSSLEVHSAHPAQSSLLPKHGRVTSRSSNGTFGDLRQSSLMTVAPSVAKYFLNRRQLERSSALRISRLGLWSLTTNNTMLISKAKDLSEKGVPNWRSMYVTQAVLQLTVRHIKMCS